VTDSDLSIADKAAVLATLHQVSVTHSSSVQRKRHPLTVTFVTSARRINRQKTLDPELEMLIRHSSSESHHETDYHEVKLLLYYMRNSHCLSADASKAWEVIRRCGSISSGDVHVAYKVARCG
jgi:hypothetical protein